MSSYGSPPHYDENTLNDMWIEFHQLACGCQGDDTLDPRLDCFGHWEWKSWKCGHKDKSHMVVVDNQRYCDSCDEELMKWACGCPNRGMAPAYMNCPDHEHYIPWECGHTDDPRRINIRAGKVCRICHGRRIYQTMKETYTYHHDLYEAANDEVERYQNILARKAELSKEQVECYKEEEKRWRKKRKTHSTGCRDAGRNARSKFERVHDGWDEESWARDYEEFRGIMSLLLRA